ncbi:HNH endonuclease [Knoellia locipacati]|uniref:HNH endonuclease signature motif containing protein n=1 Tax=Knoellia locipacati TaxID=882824 RepID=UPI00384D530D
MDEDVSSPEVAQLCAALDGARDALGSDGVGEVLARMSGPELARVMRVADDVASRARAAQVRVTAEAAHRGEFTAARRGIGSVDAWVREHAPSLRQAGCSQVAHLAQEVASSVPGGLWSSAGPAAGAFTDLDRAEGVVWARVVTGEVAPALAVTALREMARMKDLLNPAAVPTVAGAVLDHGVAWGAREAQKIRPHLLARFGAEGEFDKHQGRLRSSAFLTSPRINDGDITEYRLGLTPEQAATLEAAIGPLSRPAPNEQTGERDLRPAELRRAEALAAVCAGAASEEGARRSGPGSASMSLHVSMTLADLMSRLETAGQAADADDADDADDRVRTGCGQVLASRAQGTILAPAVVRRLACDADVLPVVLGSEGEVLDLGRAVRLFSRGQRRALWTRDGGCTYPGCDMPAGWSRAHHVVHWVDGGRSDLENAALLCQRHHTFVHDRRLIATVHPPDEHGRSVTWDLTPGSYDRVLPDRMASLRRARVGRAEGRARLDTGPPDAWASSPPDEVLRELVDDLLAEHLARDAHERDAPGLDDVDPRDLVDDWRLTA